MASELQSNHLSLIIFNPFQYVTKSSIALYIFTEGTIDHFYQMIDQFQMLLMSLGHSYMACCKREMAISYYCINMCLSRNPNV